MDLTCFSPTTNDFTTFISSMINFGSGLPEPNGDKRLIFLKNLYLKQTEIFESQYKDFFFQDLKFFF